MACMRCGDDSSPCRCDTGFQSMPISGHPVCTTPPPNYSAQIKTLQSTIEKKDAEIERLREALKHILSHTDNEITSYPYWAIVEGGKSMRVIEGIWFNREDAEKWFEGHRYRYPNKAMVYCFSGHASTHMHHLYDSMKALKESTNG